MDNKFVLSQSFNDIVFEKRNKKYGAYEIRRKYTRYALIAGASAILFFTCGSLTWAYVQAPDEEHMVSNRIIDITELPKVVDENQPKPEKQEPKPEPQKVSAADLGPKTQPLTTVIDITDTDSIPPGNLEAGKDPGGIVGGTGTGPKVEGGCLDCPKDSGTGTPPPVRIIEWSNHPPTCPELDAYLAKNIRYPEICREQGIEGTVYVQFIVDTKGDYRDIQIVKGPHPAMNNEALRVMKTMPKWTPAEDDNGVLVDYLMRKPIRFALTK